MIVIAVENWARELGYKADIAVSLAKNTDHKILLAPKNFVNLILPIFRGTYLHKSLQPHFEKSVLSLKKKGGRFLIIDDEAIIRDLPLKSRYGLDPSLCDCVFATSKAEEESYLSEGFNNILLTGNPRFLKPLLYQPPLKKRLEKILFSSNFSMKRPAGSLTLEKVIADQNLDHEEEKRLREFISMHNKREINIRAYLQKLAEQLTVIYRVHPLENEDSAYNAFIDSNVTVTKGGEIRDAISSADLVMHAGCTAALDAANLGKRSGWLYISKNELEMEKASLSITFETTPDIKELRYLWSKGEFSLGNDMAVTNLIGNIGVKSREKGIQIIATELAIHGNNVSPLVWQDFFFNFFSTMTVLLRWIKNFYLDAFEISRYDKTAHLALKSKSKLNSCKARGFLGGIFVITKI